MFEKCARLKIRFPHNGSASAEDLWDLSLAKLDGVYRELRTKQKGFEEDSLLGTKSTASELVGLQIDVVKHIVSVKQAEAEDRRSASEKSAQRNKIAEIIADKKDEALKNMSLEDLQKHLESLK